MIYDASEEMGEGGYEKERYGSGRGGGNFSFFCFGRRDELR